MSKRGYRLREGDQIPTRLVSFVEIMSQPEFALGVADARAGRPYRSAYGAWRTNDQWGYERGRAWATLAPKTVQLKRNGQITREAVQWFQRHRNNIL
jgi:hypothetical protein